MNALRLTVILLFLAGCSTTRPIEAWQQRLTDYTTKEGHGDMSILRESAELRSPDSLRPAQIRFDHDNMAAEGLPPFVDRLDAHGVMVGQGGNRGTPQFFFLVGIVQRPYSGGATKVEDLRLVSCTTRKGKHDWKVSDPNPHALDMYVSTPTGQSQEPHPIHCTFPQINDDFRFEVRGNVAYASDSRSGAKWSMSVD